MSAEPRPDGGRSHVAVALAGLGVLAALLVAAGRARAPDEVPLPGRGAAAQGRPAPGPVEPGAQVGALLRERARALLARDRPAFLAQVDPRPPGAVARQAALFDAVAAVRLSAWSYALDPGQAPPAGDTWTVRAVLSTGLAGTDADPAESARSLTLARHDGRWEVTAELPAPGAAALLWDAGRVVTVQGTRSLVLGHPGAEPELRRLAAEADDAVPRVTALWGAHWAQRVAVLVPADAAELGRLVPAAGDLGQLAAVAVTAPVRGGTARGGDRVVVDPPAFARLGPTGRRVVLTHEVLHVAARAATGDAVPTWLREGLADHAGWAGTGVPVAVAAQELAAQVRAGRLPAALPADADLAPARPDLAAAYEQSWLAVELLVRTYGEDRVVTLYRDLGAAAGGPAAVEGALRARLGTDLPAFTAAWRADLRRQLG